MHFNSFKALKNLLANTALAEHTLNHARNNTARNPTSARAPDTTDLLLAAGLFPRPRRNTDHVHILGIGNTRLSQAGWGVDAADREQFQSIRVTAACDGDGHHSVCDSDLFAVRIEDDILADGNHEQRYGWTDGV